jgi:RNA polymerase sigma-70 factor, ECF subfamily
VTAEPAIDEVFGREAGRVLATLIRLLGDFDRAEEARQDAFEAALEQWPSRGIPANPRAWLVSAGRNKAVDRVRREALLRSKMDLERPCVEAAAEVYIEEDDEAVFGDDRLRLIFTCCHPALSSEAQIALTLREVCGLTTEAVSRAFLVGEETMAQRLVRAKKKIREAGIPYETPPAELLDERIDGVLAVIYSVFTEGYAVTSGTRLLNEELCDEAIRLGRLVDALLPKNAAIAGLKGLMLLHDARRHARVSDDGNVVLLEDQDRGLWDQEKIREGSSLIEESLGLPGRTSPYAVQAAIAALHVRAPNKDSTDWRQIVGLYEVLLRLQPTPVVELNHAVAVSMVDGAARALDLVDSIAARGEVKDYHLLNAVRGNLLHRLGRNTEAREAYSRALAEAKVAPERRLIAQRIAQIEAGETAV